MLRTFEGFVDFKTCNFLENCTKILEKSTENKNMLRTSLGLRSKKLRTLEGFKKFWCSYKKKKVYINVQKNSKRHE